MALGAPGEHFDGWARGGHDVAANRGPLTVLRCILYAGDMGLDSFARGGDAGQIGRSSRRLRRRRGRGIGSGGAEGAVAQDVVGFCQHEADEAGLVDGWVRHFNRGGQVMLSTRRS